MTIVDLAARSRAERTGPNAEGKLTGAQALVAFLSIPVQTYLSVATWMALYGWFLEPVVHFHFGWWHAFGLGTISTYYTDWWKASETSDKVIMKSGGWYFVSRVYFKYGFVYALGRFAHFMMVR